MEILPDGSLNFYASKAKAWIVSSVFTAGIIMGLILFIFGKSAAGLIIAVISGSFLFFFSKPVLDREAFVKINGDMIELYGCVPLNLGDVKGTRMQSLRGNRLLIFDVADISKYKPNLSQKTNNLCGFGYFYLDINILSEEDRFILRSELSKHFPVTYF